MLILTGPTGSGKSDWALRLAQQLPVEIISVDSAQVFRGMDVGTAKPSPAARAAVPHHLLDILDPAQTYSAGQFAQDAVALIGQIRARGAYPAAGRGHHVVSARSASGGWRSYPVPRRRFVARSTPPLRSRVGPRCTPNWRGSTRRRHNAFTQMMHNGSNEH